MRLISKKEIWFTKKWIEIYHDFIFRFWNLSIRIIIDRNFKFINEFWTILFQKCDVVLNLIIVYHFFANDQIERINQTIETTLRCLFIDQYEENWSKLLSKIKYVLNTTKNAFINVILFELLYNVKSRKTLKILELFDKSKQNIIFF